MKKRWISAARCVETISGNFAVVGLPMAIYQQEPWPVLPIAAATAAASIIIAWMVPHD